MPALGNIGGGHRDLGRVGALRGPCSLGGTGPGIGTGMLDAARATGVPDPRHREGSMFRAHFSEQAAGSLAGALGSDRARSCAPRSMASHPARSRRGPSPPPTPTPTSAGPRRPRAWCWVECRRGGKGRVGRGRVEAPAFDGLDPLSLGRPLRPQRQTRPPDDRPLPPQRRPRRVVRRSGVHRPNPARRRTAGAMHPSDAGSGCGA